MKIVLRNVLFVNFYNYYKRWKMKHGNDIIINYFLFEDAHGTEEM